MILHTPRIHFCDMKRSHTAERPSPRPSPELSHLAKLKLSFNPQPLLGVHGKECDLGRPRWSRLRIRQPVQGTRAQSRVWEDRTCG